MRKRIFFLPFLAGALLLLFTLSPLKAAMAQSPSPLPGDGAPSRDSAELILLFKADQAERENFTKMSARELLTMRVRDRKRRERVLELMQSGALSTAMDYYCAAMIYQHGEKPDDFLVAHILSTISAFNGYGPARWLSAASLDRYLRSRENPQVFFTQYSVDGKGSWSLEPHCTLVPEKVQKEFGVPSLEETMKFLEERNKEQVK
ncbi:MAG: hypothetical protein RDV48_15360 [Candidatus Eremiobacteraeota bacterium]|nr:hypothetical protein [Candidatus Eremiobacteraeota bacterium]